MCNQCAFIYVLSSFENVDSAIAEMDIFGFQKVPFWIFLMQVHPLLLAGSKFCQIVALQVSWLFW